MNALIVTTDNEITSVPFPANFNFDWVREKIGCEWIEIVHPEKLSRKFAMLIDDNGKMYPNEINRICSWLYGTERHGDAIVGDAVIVKEVIDNGEPSFTGLDDDDVLALLAMLTEGRR